MQAAEAEVMWGVSIKSIDPSGSLHFFPIDFHQVLGFIANTAGWKNDWGREKLEPGML